MTDLGGGQAAVVEPAEDVAVPASSAPNIVRLPNGHTVILRPDVTIPLGIAALSVFRQGGSQAIIEAGLAEVYLRLGPMSWTFVDAEGKSEPINEESIARLLPFADGGLEVAEAADALYSPVVMRPLLKRAKALSLLSQTDNTTPPPSPNGSTPHKRSGRSSHGPTAGTP